MNKYFRLFLLISIALLFASCNNSSHKGPKVDSSNITEVDIGIHRYGKALFESDTNDFFNEIRSIQDEYSLFLGNNIEDPAVLSPLYEYVTDTQLIAISKKTMEIYPDLDSEENQLSEAFSRYHYYFSEEKIPTVYTFISDLHHENSVIVNDSIVVIALDVYLGEDYIKYRSLGLPYYRIRCMTPDNLTINVMKAMYVNNIAPRYKQKTLLERMIAGGKLLYYLDAVLPDVPDSLKICYTSQQMNWIEENKANVWAFLVENKLFYTADYKIQTKLIEDGPFTSGFSNNSPSRMGIWLGWQIVRSYMDKHPKISLHELIRNSDSQEIFNQSRYKP